LRFFDHQHEARRQTLQLLAGFALAVLATVAGVHVALALALGWRVLSWLLGGVAFPAFFFSVSVNMGVTLLPVLGSWWLEVSDRDAPGAVERVAQRAGAREARPLHPALHHLLLVSDGGPGAGWFDAHPPLAECVQRIDGRPMAPLPLGPVAADAEPATAPGASRVEGSFTLV
jgi:hypothetical protein